MGSMGECGHFLEAQKLYLNWECVIVRYIFQSGCLDD
jgi:hypothetical protein